MTRWIVALVLLCAVAQAQQPQPAAPKDRRSFSFVIFGDRTGGRPEGIKVLERAVAASNRLAPDFVMTVGDLVQGYNTGDKWLQQMREYKAVMAKLKQPWYPVAGNHDVYGGRGNRSGNVDLYRKHFAPLWYSFDYKWAHFVVLFSDEHLSFRNPAKDQNMSPEQLAWLRQDLLKTKARQVYVFLHHPRWLYKGTNWPAVHKVLAQDGRVQAVYAGHLHVYRDDGVKDGVHYYTVAVTGGNAGGLKSPVALQHMNHILVTPQGPTMSVLPVGSVVGSNLALGKEVDTLNALRRGDWLQADNGVACALGRTHQSRFHATLTNPAATPVAYELRLELPKGWTGKPMFVGGQLQPGQRFEHDFEITATAYSGRLPRALLRAVLHHPLKSGLVHPVHHSRILPVRVVGLPSGPLEKNRVLALDGNSALRVDTGRIGSSAFTLECWVRGDAPEGVRALIAKTESSAFGLWWSGSDRRWPYGVVGSQQLRKYLYVEATKGWKYDRWTHVALCNGDGWIRLFVNGKLASETELSGMRSHNRHPLYIGADPDRRGKAKYFFKGALDEVRFSTVVRYEKNFVPKRRFERDDATYLLFHFDREFDGLHPDDSGRNIHAWRVGNPQLVEERR